MKAPDPPQYTPDPALAEQQKQAEADKVTALQEKLQGDTSSIMSRYGALLAMTSGSGGAAAAAPASASGFGGNAMAAKIASGFAPQLGIKV